MTIAAVAPVWNGREWLRRMLASLARQTQPVAQIIAVDNGSTDGAPDTAREFGARVISMGRNAGFAAAVNRGVQEACRIQPKAAWIAVLNTDVELADDYLARLAACNSWFATGKLLKPGTTQIDGTFDLMSRSGAAWRAGSGREDGALFSERRAISFAPFTAALFRAELFDRVGLLEERFESYLEDVDFGLRCAALGLEGIYEPMAVAWHKGSATLGRWHPDTVRRIARNQIYLAARHFPSALLRQWFRPILAGRLLWGGVAARHGCTVAWARGVIEGMRGFRSMRAASTPVEPERLRRLLSEHERLIREIQSATGFDAYWRWYFRLAGEA
ncbi:MAG TPA: glycosyltransferase family 2 protein [Rhizomicrobium sp.]|jgi:hypothetical protein|nr:glycosyltransferase family 2 protein [Rhizomicrobium sp.]